MCYLVYQHLFTLSTEIFVTENSRLNVYDETANKGKAQRFVYDSHPTCSLVRWHAVMPLPLIAASDSFPILPLAIIFVNQRQGQYGTALFSGYHILPQPETMKNR